MSGKSNMLLTKLWSEVERPIKETPSLYTLGVLRIDESALVLETHAQESGIVGLGLFAMCLSMVGMPAMLWGGVGFSSAASILRVWEEKTCWDC